MWNLKTSTNELIYKNRNRLTDRKETCGYQGEREVAGYTGSMGLTDVHCHIQKKQQGLNVSHREPYSIPCNEL